MNNHYLFYISQNYSFEILRPLQKVIVSRGGTVLWFVEGNDVNTNNFLDSEVFTTEMDEAVMFEPLATYVPGNMVPSFISGLKVQIFHGLEWKKKGHFAVRGCFDLYCTHGPATTQRFSELANVHGYFDVIETGWPKLDGLFSSDSYCWPENSDKKTILFAPTFSPSLTSAPALFDEIARLSKERNWNWLVKFHPKMDPSWIEKYRQLNSETLKVVDDCNVSQILQSADVMVSDTSSIIGEFALLGKSTVTLNNLLPGDYILDINDPKLLEVSIERALKPVDEFIQQIAQYVQAIHPYSDGRSAERIFEATQAMLINGKQNSSRKPMNIFRNLKLRRKLNYWKFK